MPEQIAHFARSEEIADIEQAVGAGVEVGEQFGIVEGLRHRQAAAQGAGAVRKEDGVAGTGAADAKAQSTLLLAHRIDEHLVDEKHCAQIDSEPHAIILPTQFANA